MCPLASSDCLVTFVNSILEALPFFFFFLHLFWPPMAMEFLASDQIQAIVVTQATPMAINAGSSSPLLWARVRTHALVL